MEVAGTGSKAVSNCVSALQILSFPNVGSGECCEYTSAGFRIRLCEKHDKGLPCRLSTRAHYMITASQLHYCIWQLPGTTTVLLEHSHVRTDTRNRWIAAHTSWPLVSPSPSESAWHSSTVHSRSAAPKAWPKGLRAPPPEQLVWPTPLQMAPEPSGFGTESPFGMRAAYVGRDSALPKTHRRSTAETRVDFASSIMDCWWRTVVKLTTASRTENLALRGVASRSTAAADGASCDRRLRKIASRWLPPIFLGCARLRC